MKTASRLLLSLLIIFSFQAEAKLLDKIAGIVNDNIITLSQIKRTNSNLAIKHNVAPMIYNKKSYTEAEMLQITVHKFLIRAKLAELGYTITDDQVEAQIKSNQDRLGVDRNALLGFLKQQGTTYDEYFETLREAIEFSYFINRVISPLVSISEQDVKNTYYKKNINSSARMNFKYDLVNYAIGREYIQRPAAGKMEEVVRLYKSNGILPDSYSELLVINLDEIVEEGLTKEVVSALKNTDEGSFTPMIVLNNQYHVFYIAKKDLVETRAYLNDKDKIKNELYEKALLDETALWFEREKNKHYIKLSL